MTINEPIDIENNRCDRATIVVMRAEIQGWITVHDRKQLIDTIRIALDTEVRAGGPFLDKTIKTFSEVYDENARRRGQYDK